MSARGRPHQLLPPIMQGPGEVIPSEVVLREFPEEQSVVLWKTVTTVRLWAELPEAERPHAFQRDARDSRREALKGAEFPPEVLVALEKASAVLQPRARAATVATACRTIADWAESQGALGTAIEFLQAAAVCQPQDPELAGDIARHARTRREYARAETWYRHAISRARLAQNWHEFSRSYLGLGVLFMLRGSYPQARRSLLRGLRAAQRFAIRPLVAAGYHELAVLAIQRRTPAAVTRFTMAALEAYGPRHPRLPALAFDYAGFLLDSGYFAEALRIYKSIPREFGEPRDRLIRAAAVVRAAAGADDRDAYHAAWEDAETLLGNPATASAAATALLSMARGAQLMGDLKSAEHVAREAQRIATNVGEAEVELAARGVLESIQREAVGRALTGEVASRKVLGIVRRFEKVMPVVGSV